VYVEPRGPRPLRKSDEARLSQNLRLAEGLGAEVVTLFGDSPSDAILRFAKEQNVTKIIVGKPVVAGWRDRFRTSLVDQLVRNSGDIDVYVTAGDREPEEQPAEPAPRAPLEIPSFVAAAVITTAATGVAWGLFGREQLPDVVMMYLLGIMLIAGRFGLGPSIFAAFLSVAAFDFFFVPPFLTFAVGDLRHTTTFLVMFLVAVVISGLTERIRQQAAAARQRERRTAALYRLSRELAAAQGSQRVIAAAAVELEKVFNCRVSVFIAVSKGKLVRAYASTGLADTTERDASIAHWVWLHRQEAGLGTITLPSTGTLYLPLLASDGIVGVLGLTPQPPERFDAIEQRRQVDAFSAQMALALERALLSEEAEKARREVEAEQLRSALLSSVSHDLRTPLAVITGAASTLLESTPQLAASARQDLTRSILEEAERLNRLIKNLLDMTRLESGAVQVKREWVSLEEVVGAALNRLEGRLAERELRVALPADLPLLPFDAVLIEQVLINLLENSLKYGADPIEISASAQSGGVMVEVADHGPGIPVGEEARVFDKFHRAAREGSPGGVGLGLAICRGIVAAHGGKIWVQNREQGGAAFRFTLPLVGEPPRLPVPEPAEAPPVASTAHVEERR
jgi:two-component system sensor histidine kinase KdpD